MPVIGPFTSAGGRSVVDKVPVTDPLLIVPFDSDGMMRVKAQSTTCCRYVWILRVHNSTGSAVDSSVDSSVGSAVDSSVGGTQRASKRANAYMHAIKTKTNNGLQMRRERGE